jgi:hemolysin activation/secretion protein
MLAPASLAALAAGLATASPAAAQPAPAPPTRQEIESPVRSPADTTAPRLEVEGELPRAPCALDRPEYEAIRFTPTEVEFADLRGMAPADLAPAYAEYIGREQPLSVICAIRDRAAAILRRAGYIAAVEVPEQRIEGGRVRLRVLMARLVDLRVRGDAGRNERLIAAYLENLLDQEVFNTFQAERYLLLAGDLPGYTVRLSLRPAGTLPGEVAGEVIVVRRPGRLDLNLQNYGSREVGRYGGLLRAQFNGLTGLGDRTVFGLYSTADFEEQQTVQVAHDFRLGDEGLRIGGQVTYSRARPSLQPALDIESRTFFATAEAAYPIVRRQRVSFTAGIGLDVVDQEVDFFDLPLSEDRLRVLFGRLDGSLVGPEVEGGRRGEPAWRLDGRLELRQGLSGLGASDGCDETFANCTAPGVTPPSRLEGRPDATLLRGALSGEWRPRPDVALFVGFSGQATGDPLFSFEEFSAGNYTAGRGYDPAVLTGDRGAGVQAELRLGSLRPQSERDLAVQAYLFFDAAWVGNEDAFALAMREDLQSAGGGVRALWGDRAQIDVTLAVPLVRTGLLTETPDPRLLVSLTTRLWPWNNQ